MSTSQTVPAPEDYDFCGRGDGAPFIPTGNFFGPNGSLRERGWRIAVRSQPGLP